MVRRAVVDTSVAFKWLCPRDEHGTEEAASLLYAHRAGDVALCAPATFLVELANAVRCSPHFAPEDTLTTIRELEKLAIAVADATPERLAAAAGLSYEHKMSLYDALFLALAEELECPLVTADRKAFANLDTKVEIRLI
jgi:predicted nucleic acid-binding protein